MAEEDSGNDDDCDILRSNIEFTISEHYSDIEIKMIKISNKYIILCLKEDNTPNFLIGTKIDRGKNIYFPGSCESRFENMILTYNGNYYKFDSYYHNWINNIESLSEVRESIIQNIGYDIVTQKQISDYEEKDEEEVYCDQRLLANSEGLRREVKEGQFLLSLDYTDQRVLQMSLYERYKTDEELSKFYEFKTPQNEGMFQDLPFKKNYLKSNIDILDKYDNDTFILLNEDTMLVLTDELGDLLGRSIPLTENKVYLPIAEQYSCDITVHYNGKIFMFQEAGSDDVLFPHELSDQLNMHSNLCLRDRILETTGYDIFEAGKTPKSATKIR